ncbi:inositol monophosphatase family protein [Weissella uvarum]|nr:inositol monophosphatase family protein [Weissella uvarum]MCM0595591.1 inositol monophosphatase family protein [Weissella uvarum]
MTIEQIDQTVLGWLANARQQILESIKQPLDVDEKSSQRDLVTNVDKEIEQYYVQQIHALMPQARIISEEGYGDDVQTMDGDVWFVDPIDGTLNFVKQHDEFASMLALYRDGQPVLAWIMDVMNDQVVHGGPDYGVYCNQTRLTMGPDYGLTDGLVVLSGVRLLLDQHAFQEIAKSSIGFRIYGSAGIAYMHVLLGKAVAYVSEMKPWDFAAGAALGQGLGLKVSDVDGQPLNMLLSGAVVVSTPRAHADIMGIEKQAKGL